MKTLFRLVIALLAITPLRAATPAAGNAAGNSLRVRILMFSGRPDPVLTITDPNEIAEVLALVNRLPANASFAKSSVIAPVLGYRGVAIDNLSTRSPDIRSVLAHGVNVEVHHVKAANGTSVKEFRLDSGGTLEAKLLDMAAAKRVISPEILDSLKAKK